jgi:Ca2+:H+ antiporter
LESLIAAGAFEKNKQQSFSKHNTSIQSSMLFLAIIGLAVPTLLSHTVLGTTTTSYLLENQAKLQLLSDILAFLLLSAYVAGIVFTFVTHKQLFNYSRSEQQKEGSKATAEGQRGQENIRFFQKKEERHRDHQQYEGNSIWSKKMSFMILGISMVGVVALARY